MLEILRASAHYNGMNNTTDLVQCIDCNLMIPRRAAQMAQRDGVKYFAHRAGFAENKGRNKVQVWEAAAK
jgi:hypothetical protein